ncbi:hypothetical protein HELRODRAFT_173455 [Helobdella robusta]|uniref:Syndecan n=1 Tax=Helobdella robusta TaxID=6412 RepID=T1F6U9_HELRO|nr:hypothetical protein HELRODRAFT_173455 [Helobdella robusta]ESO03754.1 hypothetical protein HELRODRAFT_173455 [Helobdella robusta]
MVYKLNLFIVLFFHLIIQANAFTGRRDGDSEDEEEYDGNDENGEEDEDEDGDEEREEGGDSDYSGGDLNNDFDDTQHGNEDLDDDVDGGRNDEEGEGVDDDIDEDYEDEDVDEDMEEDEEEEDEEEEDGESDDGTDQSNDNDSHKNEPCVLERQEVERQIILRKSNNSKKSDKKQQTNANYNDDEEDGDDDEDGEELRLPECTALGEFKLKQCSKRHCWCVNKQGVKLEGSRRSGELPLSCESFDPERDAIHEMEHPKNLASMNGNHHSSGPAFLAVVAILVITGLLGSALLGIFVVYRMRKKDEGSYALANSSNNAPERRSTRSLIFNNANNNNNSGSSTGCGVVGGFVGVVSGGGNKDQDQHFGYNIQQPLQQMQQQQEFYA